MPARSQEPGRRRTGQMADVSGELDPHAENVAKRDDAGQAPDGGDQDMIAALGRPPASRNSREKGKAAMKRDPEPDTTGPAGPGMTDGLAPLRNRPVTPRRATAPRLRVVIVGSGFGGLACARALDGAPVEVLLIDRDNYHLFTPLLNQVASALLNPADIAYPLRKVFRRSRNIRFRQGVVTGVDFEAQVVRLHDGALVRYDRLVLATDATTSCRAWRWPPGPPIQRNHVFSVITGPVSRQSSGGR
jgi:hypothetical protein